MEDAIWNHKKVLVTGGSSFIGSHLVDALVERGAQVRIVDDLTSGRRSNIESHLKTGRVTFVEADLREPGVARAAMKGIEVVFHLAADHGGRGYVDLHQAGPASNLFLDGVGFLGGGEGWCSRKLFTPHPAASIPITCRPTRARNSICAKRW